MVYRVYGVMDIVEGNHLDDPSSNFDEVVCITHCKRYEIIYSPSYRLTVGNTGLLNFGMATSIRERKA